MHVLAGRVERRATLALDGLERLDDDGVVLVGAGEELARVLGRVVVAAAVLEEGLALGVALAIRLVGEALGGVEVGGRAGGGALGDGTGGYSARWVTDCTLLIRCDYAAGEAPQVPRAAGPGLEKEASGGRCH